MATRIFDNEIVRAHPIYKDASSTLKEVSLRDYASNPFDDRIECLDMDFFESKFVKHGANDSTMDVTIGIADYDGCRKTNSALLMVELRLGYQSMRNLKAESLNKKVLHTLELLNPAEYSVSKDAVFVFAENVFQRAKNWIFRYKNSNHSGRAWDVMSPEIFSKAYMCMEDVPYTPIYDYDDARKQFERLVSDQNWEAIADNFDIWGKRYYQCFQISQERELIVVLLKETWQKILEIKNDIDETDWEFLSLLEEDWNGILK